MRGPLRLSKSTWDPLERLRTFTVLDPACGSGNFLYLALQALKDLEHRVQLEAEALGAGSRSGQCSRAASRSAGDIAGDQLGADPRERGA